MLVTSPGRGTIIMLKGKAKIILKLKKDKDEREQLVCTNKLCENCSLQI